MTEVSAGCGISPHPCHWHQVTSITLQQIILMIIRIWTKHNKNFNATIGALRNFSEFEPEFYGPAWHRVSNDKYASPSP